MVLIVKIKEEKIKELNKERAEIEQYRNDYKYAKEHGFIPSIPYPKWMKKEKNLKFNDEGK
mgnify:CR=1 FL=1